MDHPPHRHYPECASTNDLAREWAWDASAPEGASVSAGFQTAGRGRRGRTWLSVPGENLLLSVVLRPPDSLSEAWTIGFVAALAVSDALAEFGIASQLKWPNDVLVAGRKISGVLVETTAGAGDWAAVVGIGVNVNQASFADEDSYEVRPISMRIARGEETSVESVRASVVHCLLQREAERRSHGFAPIAAAWRERMAPNFEIRRGPARGIQDALESDGRIRVRLADGTFTHWGTVDGEGTF